MRFSLTSFALALALLVSLPTVRAQGSPVDFSSPPPEGDVRGRALHAVLKVWNPDRDEAAAVVNAHGMSAGAFAVEAMLARGANVSIARVESLRRTGLTWRAVALAVGAKLPSAVGTPPPAGGAPGADDAAIEIEAEVKTLERLTGRSAESFRRRLEAGESFETIASEAADLMGGVAGRAAASEGRPSAGPKDRDKAPGPLRGAPPSSLPGSQGQISTQGEGRGFQTPRR